MTKRIDEHSKSLDEIFSIIDLIEGCLKNYEKRISAIEEKEKNREYQQHY